MHRQPLFLLAAIFLFCNVSCPEECEELFFGGSPGGALTVDVENPSGAYAVGDEIIVGANFSAVRDAPRGQTYIIGEAGGLLVVEVYRVMLDSVALEPALAAFDPLLTEGVVLPPPAADSLGGALRVRYVCPDGNCGFRLSLGALEPGNYVLRVLGGPIDEVGAAFDFCDSPRLSFITLTGGGNAGPVLPEESYRTPYLSPNFGLAYNRVISAGGAPDTYFFSVE